MANKNKDKLEIQTKLSVRQLEIMIGTVLTFNENVVSETVDKIWQLITNINPEDYDDDLESIARIWVLRNTIKLRKNKKLRNCDDILDNIRTLGKFQEEIENIVECINEIWDEEENGIITDNIYYIDELVSDILQYSFIFKYQDKLDEYSVSLHAGEYGEFDTLHEFCEAYRSEVSNLYAAFKKSESISRDNENDFSTADGTLRNAVTKSIKELNSPASKLKTSVRMKNDMLNGGYESGRFYLVLGVQGGGKSVELTQAALDIKHCNKNIELPNGKQPVILYVSQENSRRESLERFWNFYVGNSDEFKKHSTDEVMEILAKHGFTDGIELAFKYRKSRTISTQDIDNMINKIEEDETKKVIAVIHDYLKRIRSANYVRGLSLYEELGEVTDEFCNIAKEHDLVVISAMQFNRSGLQKIEEALKKNKDDVLKTLGTSDIGESVKIVDNSDIIYSIHRKPNPLTGDLMISYKLMKYRGKRPTDAPDYFSHPFEDGNTMKLKSDIGLTKSLSLVEMSNGLENFDPAANRRNRQQQAQQQGKTTYSGGRPKSNKAKSQALLQDDDDDD